MTPRQMLLRRHLRLCTRIYGGGLDSKAQDYVHSSSLCARLGSLDPAAALNGHLDVSASCCFPTLASVLDARGRTSDYAHAC